MPRVLFVAPREPEPELGGTVLWRGDVERSWLSSFADALPRAAELLPSLVVIDGDDAEAAQLLTRSIRFHEATRGTAIAVMNRGLSHEFEMRLLGAGATVILPVPVDPLLWDGRLEELIHVPQRREARIPVRLAVWSRFTADQEPVEGTALNISLRGILLEAQRPLPLGGKLDISFHLPGDPTNLRAVGEVVRHAGLADGQQRCGIAFLVLRGEARNRIGAFVDFARRAPLPVSAGLGEAAEGSEWEAELKASEARKAAILDSALDCVITVDHEGRILEFNAAAERTFGYPRGDVFGRRATELLVPPELRDEVRRRLGHFVDTGERTVLGTLVETSARRSDGSGFPVELAVSPMYVNGRLLLTAYVRDVTERRRRERLTAAEHDATRALAESHSVEAAAERILAALGAGLGWEVGGFWLLEEAGPRPIRLWAASSAVDWAPARGGSLGSLLRESLERREPRWASDLDPAGDVVPWPDARAALALPVTLAEQPLAGLLFAARSPRPLENDTLSRLAALGGQLSQFLDRQRAERQLDERLVELREAEAALRRLARFDSLTGLPNRTSFLETLDRTLLRARRLGKSVALVFLDLDGFKAVNDNLGHHAGDLLLRQTADRLRTAIRGSDFVARMGGDEFTVIVQDLARGHDAALVASKILHEVGQPCRLEGREVVVGASIGISVCPEDGDDSPTLLRHADLAMYRAKEEGKNDYRFFTAAMSERARERMAVEANLRRALARGEFVLHYQPEVQDGAPCSSVEALIRWQDPDLGLVAPARFIPHAEETGLILPIGRWVLRTACLFARELPDSVRVAVNLSARQIAQPDADRVVEEALRESGLDPRRLELEVTESSVMSDAVEVVERLVRLHQMGVQLTLDDFGTGYSSLSHLKRLRIHRIKIDRSFVLDLPASADSRAISTAIIGLAQGLGLEVVAEGVETREQLAFLREKGCRAFQGHLMSLALPPDELKAFLARDTDARRW